MGIGAVGDGDLDEAESRVTNWQLDFDERAARARDAMERIGSLEVACSAAQGMVEATVDAGGHLVDLKLDSRVRTWPAEKIASTVVAATNAARAAAAARVRELAAEAR